MSRPARIPPIAPGAILALALTGPALLLGACRTPLGAPRVARDRTSTPATPADPDVLPAGRAAVARALTEELAVDRFQVVLDERPGLGTWRLVARSEAEQRFIGLVGLRGRVQEIEARLGGTASGSTRLGLEGRVWVYAGEAPEPGGEPGPSATSSSWGDAARLEDLRRRVARRLEGEEPDTAEGR